MTLVQLGAFALEAIAEIVTAVRSARDGDITPEEALTRMKAALQAEHDLDARVDRALEDKFRDEGGGGG